MFLVVYIQSANNNSAQIYSYNSIQIELNCIPAKLFCLYVDYHRLKWWDSKCESYIANLFANINEILAD